MDAPRRIDGLVGALAIGLLIAGLGAVDLGGYWLRRTAATAEAPAVLPLGTRSVTVPGAWVARVPEGSDRLDLAIPFAAVLGHPDERLLVTASPADLTAPRTGLGLHHARFLTAVARSHPSGLVQRRFRDGTPFEGEELYLTPPDGTAFSALCAGEGTAAADCLTELRVDDLDLRVRFPAARLGEWEAILTTLRRTLAPAPNPT